MHLFTDFPKLVKRIFCLAFSLAALSPLICSAQQIRFKRVSLEQGLSQSSIQSMIQDKRGFLWFATQNGLNCYDGYSMTVYRSQISDTATLPNNYIQTLHEDRSGTLWIGTLGGGIAKMNPYSRRFSRLLQQQSSNKNTTKNPEEFNVYAFSEDNAGAMWAGTQGGLLRINPRTGIVEERFTPQNSPLPSAKITTLFTDGSGVTWIGTPKGLRAYNPSKKHWQSDFSENTGTANISQKTFNLGSGEILAFAPEYGAANATGQTQGLASLQGIAKQSIAKSEEKTNLIWIGTANGIVKLNCAKNLVETSYKLPSGGALIQTMTIDLSGTLWVGYAGDGLQKISTRNPNNPENTILRHIQGQGESLSHNAVSSVLVDRSGNLWVGTDGAGACYFNADEYRFELLGNDNGFGTNIVMSMLEDKQGLIWFGTLAAGLNSYDRKTGTMRTYTHSPSNPRSISSNFVWALAEDKSGMLWVGTNGRGLCRFDRVSGTFTTFLHDENNPETSLPDNTIYSILEASDGTLYLATGNGLAAMNRKNGTFATIRHKSDTSNDNKQSNKQGEIGSNNVRTIYESKRGVIWCGTQGGGLHRFNPATATFETFRHTPGNSNSLSSNEIVSIREDSKGILWIGTSNGFNRFDPASGSITRFHEKDGLPSEYVYSILDDASGYLWLATGKGITRFNSQSGVFNLFDGARQPSGTEFNQESCMKDRFGYLYFGSIKGFVRFHPDSVRLNYLAPPVVLTQFKKLNKPATLDTIISEKRELHLSVDDSFIAFEFAALTFAQADKIRYYSKLENFDRDWIDLGTRREATYTNLEAGEYVLHIRSTNYDGVLSPEWTSLRITVHPHWWQTIPAKVIAFVALIICGFGAYKWRIRTIEKRQQQLEKLISERTAELSAGNQEIKRQNEVLVALNVEKNEFLGIAAHDLKSPLTSMILSASIVQQYQQRMTSQEVSEQMAHILITAKRMQETILNLLDINAIESGRFKFSPTAINIVEVVNDILEGYFLRAADKDIRLHLNHEVDEIMMMCDRNALMQILENLISNAVKYSPHGKSVYVNVLTSASSQIPALFVREESQTGRTPLQSLDSERYVRVEIQDEGPGLNDEDKAMLFQKFAKLSPKPTGGEHSTGLGLSIVKKITESMGGTVWCESELDKGATFIIVLPIVEVPEELLLERLM